MNSTVVNNAGPGVVCERFYLSSKDLTAAALTQTINLKTMAKGSVVFGAVVKSDVAFAGGAISACTLKIGFAAGVTDAVVKAYDCFAAPSNTALGNSGGNAATGGPFVGTAAGDTVTATFTAVGGNLNVATAGSVHVDLFYWIFPDLTGTGPTGNALSTGGQL